MPKGWLPDCGFGDDAPRVRRPTCRCVYGRPPLLASAADQDEDETDDGLCAPPPPQWKPTKETLDLEALIAADGRAPRFEESVDLWRDDLDPHSFGFFRVRVRAHERFWVAYSRFFIRVNGVRARVIDVRFAGFGDRVLRERSWREGDWTAVAGAGAPPCVDLGGLLRRPPILCVLEHTSPAGTLSTRRGRGVVCGSAAPPEASPRGRRAWGSAG